MTGFVLPDGVTLFERGWLSSNCVLLTGGKGPLALVDSGYHTHSDQTLRLVDTALAGRDLDMIVNTHLHSDHCGGNAALQQRYSSVRTWVPAAEFEAVVQWDTAALSYVATGQGCPPFAADGALQPGTVLSVGAHRWEVHSAPGHDPHSVVLFEPDNRMLISADALWGNGFGVVFPELDGVAAFDEVAATLDLIERLHPHVVLPGHGPAFTDVTDALHRARSRLEGFRNDPLRHARYAAKVLLKFKLLEWQEIDEAVLLRWTAETPYFQLLHQRWFAPRPWHAWVRQLADELVQASAASRHDGRLRNA
ncbi:MBL fold metallo-hydrolase [Ramlibacter sp. AN1015]|uniref:MBL fold metallo-hydrolase n=1 Tax=Ramlibacter sp. AN1015 TaxID=3133428 RepID=UPI0030C185E2